MRKLIVTMLMLAVSTPSYAHYLWLERTGATEVRSYFGEWEADRREKSGGLLDNIKSPKAFMADPAKPLALTRQADHFAIATPQSGDVRLVEAGLPVRVDKQSGLRTKSLMHAKTGRSETAAALDLELVPVAPNGNVFVLLLRGEPLPKAKLEVFAPPKWSKGLRSDDKGQLTIETPWAGQYVVEVSHVEERKGGSGDEAYDRIRHVSTLSFVVTEGLPWSGR